MLLLAQRWQSVVGMTTGTTADNCVPFSFHTMVNIFIFFFFLQRLMPQIRECWIRGQGFGSSDNFFYLIE